MRQYFLKLKTTLLYKNLIDNYHFVVLSLFIIGVIYYFKSVVFLFILILYYLYLFVKNKYVFILTMVIFSLFIASLLCLELNFKRRYLGQNTAQFTVIDNSSNLIVKRGISKYIVDTTDSYEVGDILIIKGNFKNIEEEHIPELFNYQLYSKYHRILGVVKEPVIVKTKNIFTISKIQDMICTYCDNNFSNLSSSYLKALVIGNKKSLDKTTLSSINSLGISHLFVVSGLHVELLVNMIEWLVKKIFKKSVNLITIIILILYTFMTNLSVSVLRVALGYILKQVNIEYQLKLTALDQLSIITILLLIINPYYLFNSSFILSFGLTYSLVIGSKLLNHKNYLFSLLKMSVYCQIIGLPLSYNFSNKFNLTSVIFNMMFVPFVSYIFLPVSIVIMFCPFLNIIYEYLINLFELLIEISNKFSIFIYLPKVSVVFISLFIVLIFCLFKQLEMKKIKKGMILLLLIYITIWLNYAKLDIYDQIVFFDLPNGESTLIHGAFNEYNILIDTGDVEENNTILEYLKKRGIRKLDYVIITHSDNDHIGGLEKIMSEVRVKNIITNKYERKKIFEYYHQYNKNLKVHYLKKNDSFMFKNIYFKVISPEYDIGDVNNNSLVFLMQIDDFKILFTGDIEEKAENKIEGVIKCDLLKIAHHGSKTSTTDKFLDKVIYDEAIIMNGYYNIFGFPSKTVINRIRNKPYYVTGYEKTIIYEKIFFKKRFGKI